MGLALNITTLFGPRCQNERMSQGVYAPVSDTLFPQQRDGTELFLVVLRMRTR